jgi:hypothetical protein
MSTEKTQSATPATGTDPAPAILTPEEVVQQLRTLRTQMPLVDPASVPVSKRRRLANVNPLFTAASINAAGAAEAVQSALGRSPEDLRQENDATVRWSAVEDELRTLLANVTEMNTLRRQRVGLTALQTYSICQQLARDNAHASRLAPHIAEMRRLNKFGRGRKAKLQPPTPAPTPAPGSGSGPAPQPTTPPQPNSPPQKTTP